MEYCIRIDVSCKEEVIKCSSSRLGIAKKKTHDLPGSYYREVGKRVYELSNHLGNVLVTFSDELVYNPATLEYSPKVLTATDYFPFGMQIADRSYLADGSALNKAKTGFNNQTRDYELDNGGGNIYTAQFWEYDSRIGRRWNPDVKSMKFPYLSPFAAFTCNPIIFVDPLGDTHFFSISGDYLGDNGDGKSDYKVVLDNSTAREVKSNIKKGNGNLVTVTDEMITLPNEMIIKATDEAINKTNSLFVEHGLVVSNDGAGNVPSDIVSGTEGKCPTPAKRGELESQGKDVQFDIHIHTPEKEKDILLGMMSDNTEASPKVMPDGSKGDLGVYPSVYTEPSWNIGYIQKRINETNDGKTTEVYSKDEYVNFYNGNNQSIGKTLWSSFKKGVSKANETIQKNNLK